MDGFEDFAVSEQGDVAVNERGLLLGLACERCSAGSVHVFLEHEQVRRALGDLPPDAVAEAAPALARKLRQELGTGELVCRSCEAVALN